MLYTDVCLSSRIGYNANMRLEALALIGARMWSAHMHGQSKKLWETEKNDWTSPRVLY